MKFLRIVPWATSAIVVMTIVSQVTLLLAFFLPLKVVVLLGSSGMPRYFPSSWQLLDRDFLILTLSAATVVFYLAHIFIENLINRITAYGSSQLLLRSQKLVLFENQADMAAKAYLRYSRALSGVVFSGLAMVVLFFLYPLMAIIPPVVVLGQFLFTCLLIKSIQNLVINNFSSFVGLCSGFGFFAGFSFLVVDFLFFEPPGLISAIIAILLLRQIFKRISVSLIDVVALFDQRHRLGALFFHGQAFVPVDRINKQREVWQLLEPEVRSSWLAYSVDHEVSEPTDPGEWFGSGGADVFVFYYQQIHVIKLFGKKRCKWAEHEAFLFQSLGKTSLPALRFRASKKVEGYYCHIFECNGRFKRVPQRNLKAANCLFWMNLVSVVPPARLVKSYYRSHLTLLQRFDDELFIRLSWIVTDESTREAVMSVAAKLPEIKKRISVLPLVITNPDTLSSLCVDCSDSTNIMSVHWGRWGIEPLGAFLPVPLREENALREALTQAATVRKDLASVLAEDVLLAGYLSVLEKSMNKQRWNDALKSVRALAKLLDKGLQ